MFLLHEVRKPLGGGKKNQTRTNQTHTQNILNLITGARITANGEHALGPQSRHLYFGLADRSCAKWGCPAIPNSSAHGANSKLEEKGVG